MNLDQESLDVRDIIKRVEELREDRDGYVSGAPDGTETPAPDLWRENERDDAEELDKLEKILDDLAGMGGDEEWEGDWYPVTLIRESDFEDYAQELAEDIGAISRDESWPKTHIDWEAAANELRIDYSLIEIEGVDYLYR